MRVMPPAPWKAPIAIPCHACAIKCVSRGPYCRSVTPLPRPASFPLASPDSTSSRWEANTPGPTNRPEPLRTALTSARHGCQQQTPPHGYRSAVAYDPATKSWITVGPNGTDISTDDGRNWRPLHPAPTDAPDADQNWNALSLPFVVGPHGRIGLLHP